MRLTDDVHLVGGGPLTGFGLSPGLDSHVYVLRSADKLALVDAGIGMPGSVDAIIANIRRDGLSPDDIRRVFVTHYHLDHAGGLAQWHDRLGLGLSVSREAADAIRTADGEASAFNVARDLGFYPEDYEYRPCPVDDPLDAGDTRSVGALQVEHVATPGHCVGHGCYRVTGGDRTYLFAGDCVFHGGSILQQNIPDCDMHAYRDSVLALDALDFDALLPGHGPVALIDGKAHVAVAAEAFRGLLPPKQLI